MDNLILKNLQVLISEEDLQKRIKELANEINKDYKGKEIVMISILKGSVIFTSDLIRHIKVPLQLEFIRLSSYGNDVRSCGKVKAIDLTLPNLSGKNVIIIEDIIDTGLTANFLTSYFNLQHNLDDIKFVTLLNKEVARKYEVNVTYSGFVIDDYFVVGYGLDYGGYYRNLPYVGYFPS
ncbi:MAG: hypoxanthine phosphoribosyltransferase [Candidatus Gastranaerophilales bacterium]|nr:hypoxanthine phosphoribosyltransferase [Candidatus Gastranaerophilales bacterium]